MVRSDQQLVERMTFIWHDWFANSNEQVNSPQLMLNQNELFREKALGSFYDLFLAVTADPAMLVFLDGIDNEKGDSNENYAREMMELFSLGADRGAYTEDDVREMGRALTGWQAEWSAEGGMHNFHYDPSKHDEGQKTVFGQTGNWNWEDAVRMCVEHPLHPSFFVTKLWGYFIPTQPDEATLASLQGLYTSSGFSIRAVVEAILQHPDFYEGPELVTPPVVYNAGLLRAIGRYIDTTAWAWLGSGAGPAAVLPAQRRRLGIRPLAGHLDGEGALGNRQLRGRQHLPQPVAGGRRTGIRPDRGPRRGDGERAGVLGRPAAVGRIAAVHRAVRAVVPACRNGRMGAEPLPGDPPERAAHADRHLPRHAGELRHTSTWR